MLNRLMWDRTGRIPQQGFPSLTHGLRQRCQQPLLLTPAVNRTFLERGMGAYIGHLGQPFAEQAVAVPQSTSKPAELTRLFSGL